MNSLVILLFLGLPSRSGPSSTRWPGPVGFLPGTVDFASVRPRLEQAI